MSCANESIFAKEIQMMMFGLGDCQTPLLSTAVLIESIVRQQLTVLILKTEDVAELRGSSHIEIQDILFVLREDKAKLKRMLQFIELKDTQMGIPRIMEEIDPLSGLTLQNKRQKNRIDNAMRYLLSIGIDDVSSENIQDQAKMDRLIRAEQMSQTLNDKSYLEFHKSRTCSFAAARLNQGRLFEWLKISAGDGVNKLRKDTIDIIVYLAKEVVAELIDLALIVRQDMSAVSGDPLSRAIDPLPTNLHDTYGHKQSQIEGPNPITPEEIREVVRRFMSTLLCPFGTFTRNTYRPHHNRLLIH